MTEILGAVVVTVFVDRTVTFAEEVGVTLPDEEETVNVLVDVIPDAVVVFPATVVVSEDTVVVRTLPVKPNNDETKLPTTFVV